MNKEPIILCILDGLGVGQKSDNNAFSKANTPFFDEIFAKYPNSLIKTSGIDVGLSDGQMGNSEVGHMNIGSGRIIIQDLPKINKSIEDMTICDNENLRNFISKINDNSICHLMGLFSSGGVHSSQDHIIFFAKLLSKNNIKVFLHLFADGRDTSPCDMINKIDIIEELIRDKNIKLATVSGRYYAMDRDNRWERIEKAYNAIIDARGERFNSLKEVLEFYYEKNIYDEFIPPSLIKDYEGFSENDSILIANFRPDRVRQILSSMLINEFDDFPRQNIPKIANALGMVEYSNILSPFIKPIFKRDEIFNTLPDIIEKHNLTQLRIAETEKYAHVTYFFNGGKEYKYNGEERILIESKKVDTYDLCPEMSAGEITENIINELDKEKWNIIIVNYANCDMVGHTGNFEKTVEAIEFLDKCLKTIKEKLDQKNGILIITSDHGNAEKMYDNELKLPYTAHTLNPVPLIIISEHDLKLKDGRLCDIAPTILEIMKIDKPAEMTGISLIKHN